jgi:hypothetical protein
MFFAIAADFLSGHHEEGEKSAKKVGEKSTEYSPLNHRDI